MTISGQATPAESGFDVLNPATNEVYYSFTELQVLHRPR